MLLWICLDANTVEKPFVAGTLKWRLGNQLFQAAATISHAIDHDAEAIFPDLLINPDHEIPLNRAIFFSQLSLKVPKKVSFTFNEDRPWHYQPIPWQPNMQITGQFQSEKYFKHNKAKVLESLKPKEEAVKYIREKYAEIVNHPYTVAVHVRAYSLESPKAKNMFAPIGLSYYEKAFETFGEEAIFVIFSDRMDFAKELLKDFSRPHIYLENEAYYNDFILMSLCKHQIISNSTFSWWAAYMNPNPEKIVIAPARWMAKKSTQTSRYIVPPDWITIDWKTAQ